MRTASAATNATSGFAIKTALCLEILTLAVAVLQFAFAPSTVQKPLLAAIALALLAIAIVLSRTVAFIQIVPARQHWLAIFTLTLTVTMLVVATGGAHS